MNTHHETYQNSKKIEELEGIRGLAALLVVFYHIPKWNPILNIGIINNGYLMVDVFFVLSGFVIINAYINKINTSKDLLRFQFLRFGRLYSVHLTFLLFFLVLEVAKYIATIKLGVQDIRSTPFAQNNLIALSQQIFLSQGIGPTGKALTFNVPAWSISVEFYTYLIFGLAILLFRQQKKYIFFIVAFVSIALLATQNTYGFENLLRCLGGFFIGCLTESVIKKIKKIKLPSYSSALVFISIILFLQLKSSNDFDIAIYFFTSALITTIMLANGGVVKNILKHKILVWLGQISYSIYMSHTFVLWVISNIFKRILKRPELQNLVGEFTLQLTTLDTYAAIFVIIFFVVLVSWVTYLKIEKPMREKSRRFAFSKLN
jgi:peptidoglycan/LPS O-acetylase OafA/YrhL